MWKSRINVVKCANRRGCIRQRLQKFANEAPPPGAKPTPAPKPTIPPPPPPPSKSKGSSGIFLKLFGVTIIGTAGAVGYAWYDPGFRQTVESNIPYTREALQWVFQYLPNDKSKLAPIESAEKSSSPGPSRSKPLSELINDKEPTKKQTEVKDAAVETPVPQKQVEVAKKESKVDDKSARLREKEAEEAIENSALEEIAQSLIDSCREKATQATEIQQKLIQQIEHHTQALKTAMDDTTQILNKDSQWEAVSAAHEAREEITKAANNLTLQAKEEIEKLKACIEDGKSKAVTKKNKVLRAAQNSMSSVTQELNKAANQLSKVEAESNIINKYKDLVDKAKKQFQKEVESILPEVATTSRKGGKLSIDDVNAYLAHAYRRIEQMQKQLAEQMTMEQQRLEKSLDAQWEEFKKLEQQVLAQEREKMSAELSMEKMKWDEDAAVRFEQDVRQQLVRQAAAHSDHVQAVLRTQREQLGQQFQRDIHVKILEERQVFQNEVASWISRLKGIEAAVEGRAEQEKLAQAAQKLWLACIAMNGIVQNGREGATTWEDKIMPLYSQVVAVSEVAGNHVFVNTVAHSIRDEALHTGVWTENSLKERFVKVKRICKRLALVDEPAPSLYKYFISYIQSFFIFDSVYAKSATFDVEPEKIDTFFILSHAGYFLEQGDLEQAVRLMSQLKGESRVAAGDWLAEAKLLLETRQAANVLTAFASATGLGTVF